METYDPDGGPAPREWLALDESERLTLVARYHERERVQIPSPRLHVAVHVVVENQIAEGVSTVTEAMDRLRSQGLTRHDAIHAIGSVLAKHIWEIMESGEQNAEAHERYFERLATLTAEDWLSSG